MLYTNFICLLYLMVLIDGHSLTKSSTELDTIVDDSYNRPTYKYKRHPIKRDRIHKYKRDEEDETTKLIPTYKDKPIEGLDKTAKSTAFVTYTKHKKKDSFWKRFRGKGKKKEKKLKNKGKKEKSHRKNRNADNVPLKGNNMRKSYNQFYLHVPKTRTETLSTTPENKYDDKLITEPNLDLYKYPSEVLGSKLPSQGNFINLKLSEKSYEYDDRWSEKQHAFDYTGTAQIEQLLDYIKANAAKYPSISEVITNSATENNFVTDPILKHWELNDLKLRNADAYRRRKFKDKRYLKLFRNDFNDTVTSTETYNPRFARTVKDDMMTIAHCMQDMIGSVCKKVKSKVSQGLGNCKNKTTVTTTTVTKPTKKVTPKPKTTTKCTKKSKKPSIKCCCSKSPCKHSKSNKHARAQRNQNDEVTARKPEVPDNDYAMLGICEQMLTKSYPKTSTPKSYLAYRNREKSKRDVKSKADETLKSRLSKEENKSALENLLIAIRKTFPPETYKNLNIRADLDTTQPTVNTENYEKTSYEGLSNKIAYKDFVNGYKHYLKFQKEQGDGNFSAQVKYQAHKHHNVEDIGKYILDKIPQVPSDEIKQMKMPRTKRFFDDTDIDDQDISTKSDDSWFKKHFYFFIDNGPPKKFHTSQTVSLKSPKNDDSGLSSRLSGRVDLGGKDNTDKLTNDVVTKTSRISTLGHTTSPFSVPSTEMRLEAKNQPTEPSRDQTKPMDSSRNIRHGTSSTYEITTENPRKFLDGIFDRVRKKSMQNNTATIKDSKYDVTDVPKSKKYKRTVDKETEELISKNVEETSTARKESKITTKATKKCNKCYVDIDVVPKSTTPKHSTKKSKFKEFFKRFDFKKHSPKTKNKRHVKNPKRRARFNPLKKIKDILKCTRSWLDYDIIDESTPISTETHPSTITSKSNPPITSKITTFEEKTSSSTTKSQAEEMPYDNEYLLNNYQRMMLDKKNNATKMLPKSAFTSAHRKKVKGKIKKPKCKINSKTPIDKDLEELPTSTNPFEVLTDNKIGTTVSLTLFDAHDAKKAKEKNNNNKIFSKVIKNKNSLHTLNSDRPIDELTIDSKLTRVGIFPLGEDDILESPYHENYSRIKDDTHTYTLSTYPPVQRVNANEYERANTHKYSDIFNSPETENSFKDIAYNLKDNKFKTYKSEVNTKKSGSDDDKLYNEDGMVKKLAMYDNALVTTNYLVIKGEAKFFQFNKIPGHPNVDSKSHKMAHSKGMRHVFDLTNNNLDTKETTELMDSTIFAYDEDVSANKIEFKKDSSSALDPVKKAGIVKAVINKQPTHYYATPVPMTPGVFYKFLRENNIDVPYVTRPIVDVPLSEETVNLFKKHNTKTKNKPEYSKNNDVNKNAKTNALETEYDANKVPSTNNFNIINNVDKVLHSNKHKRNIHFMKANKFEPKRTVKEKQDDTNLSLVTIQNPVTKEVEVTIINFDEFEKNPSSTGKKFKTTKPKHEIDEADIVTENSFINKRKLGRRDKGLKIDVRKFIEPLHNDLLFQSVWKEPANRGSTFMAKAGRNYERNMLEYLESVLERYKPPHEFILKPTAVNEDISTKCTDCENDIFNMKNRGIDKINNHKVFNNKNQPATITGHMYDMSIDARGRITFTPTTERAVLFRNRFSNIDTNISNTDDFLARHGGTYKLHSVIQNKFRRSITPGCKKTDLNTQIGKPHRKVKRGLQTDPNLFTAKNVAALEVIVDLIKATDATSLNVPDSKLRECTNLKTGDIKIPDSNISSIQIHVAIPFDYQIETKRQAPWSRLRKVFSAKMSSPVDLEYQIKSFEYTPEMANPTTEPIDDSLSTGMYLLVDKGDLGYALQPVKANLPNIKVRHAPNIQGATQASKVTNLNKVTLTKEFISAVNKQLVLLYGNMSKAHDLRKRRQTDIKVTELRKDKKCIRPLENQRKEIIHKRKINWNAVKRYFGHERVCNCKCKPYKPMCRACAASDAVIDELIFEFANIGKYMEDHCTEIQTYFWMNPSGGNKLRDAVQRIDRSLHDYYKRLKGKCKGKTCTSLATYMDKRHIVSSRIVNTKDGVELLTDDLNSIANDLEKLIALNTCSYPKLKENGDKFISTIKSCIYEKGINKRDSNITPKNKLLKNVYSLDNIHVNIICNPDISKTTPAAMTSPLTKSYTSMLLKTEERTQSLEDIEHILHTSFEDRKKHKTRKGFKFLIPRRSTLNKLFAYYLTPKTPNKREVEHQYEDSIKLEETLEDSLDVMPGQQARAKKNDGPNSNVVQIKSKESKKSTIKKIQDYFHTCTLQRKSTKLFVQNTMSNSTRSIIRASSDSTTSKTSLTNKVPVTETVKKVSTSTNTYRTRHAQITHIKNTPYASTTISPTTTTKEKSTTTTTTRRTTTTKELPTVKTSYPTLSINEISPKPYEIEDTALDYDDLNLLDLKPIKNEYTDEKSTVTTTTQTDLTDAPVNTDTDEFSMDSLILTPTTLPTILIINQIAEKFANDVNYKSDTKKDLLLSIIQHEREKLNEEWQKVSGEEVVNGKRSLEQISERSSIKDLGTTKTTPKSFIGDLSNEIEKPWGHIDKLMNRVKMKINTEGDVQKADGESNKVDTIVGSAEKSPDLSANELETRATMLAKSMVTAGNSSTESHDIVDPGKPEASDPLCDLSATYFQNVGLYQRLDPPAFQTHVKNITCAKYKDLHNLKIDYDRGIWSWIRGKRSAKSRRKIENGYQMPSGKDYEEFVKSSGGIYRVRKKRETGEEFLGRGLHFLPALMTDENEFFVMAGDSVTLASDSEGPWTGSLELLHQPNVELLRSSILINNVQPRNIGKYTSKEDYRKSVTINVVALPNFDVIFLPMYRTPGDCTYDDLKAVKLLGSSMAKEMNCNKMVCSIRVDDSVCLKDKKRNISLVKATAVLSVHPQPLNCSVECRRDMLSSFVFLAAANVPVVKDANVTIIDGRGMNRTLLRFKGPVSPVETQKLRTKDSTGYQKYHRFSSMAPSDVNVVVSCPAGYYLMKRHNLCAACPANTSSFAGDNVCSACPPGTRAPAGSQRCVHYDLRRYDWWIPWRGVAVAGGGVVVACGACVVLALFVTLTADAKIICNASNSRAGESPRSCGKRPLSPSRVILARFFKPSLTSSRDSQETKFEMWKERNIPPPLPPIDFDS